MAERDGLLYSLLSHSAVYLTVQRLFRSEHVREALLDSIQPTDGQRVLDIGCGPATILKHLPRGVHYIGFEPNGAYIDRAKELFPGRGEFHVGYFDDAAANSTAPVDTVIVKAVLHHMSDIEVRDLFRLITAVLKPGGRVVTVDPTFRSGQNPIARLTIGLDRGKNVREPDTYLALARERFANASGTIITRRFPPYDYWVMTASAS